MKLSKVRTLLAIYSLILATSLFVWALLVERGLLGIVLSLLLLPVAAYFWVTISMRFKKKVDPTRGDSKQVMIAVYPKWNTRAPLTAILTLFIVSASILTYALVADIVSQRAVSAVEDKLDDFRAELSQFELSPEDGAQVNAELDRIKNELVNLRAGNEEVPIEDLDDFFATVAGSFDNQEDNTAVSGQDGVIELSGTWSQVDVYIEPKSGSKVIGQIKQDKLYTALSKENGWYQIKLPTGEVAWVNQQFVTEVVPVN